MLLAMYHATCVHNIFTLIPRHSFSLHFRTPYAMVQRLGLNLGLETDHRGKHFMFAWAPSSITESLRLKHIYFPSRHSRIVVLFQATQFTICFNYQLNAQFLYYIYILHYSPRHVSSNTMLILRRSNCIVTASGIVTLCKQPYSAPVESGRVEGYNVIYAY
jgi:hypothetical protein